MYEFNHIYQGDATKILPKIENNSFDLILTSPPFKDADAGIGQNSAKHRIKNPENGEKYYLWLDKILKECKRISPLTIMFNSSVRLVDICSRYQPARVLVWDKIRTMAAYRYEPIFIFLGNKPTPHKINKGIYNDCLKFLPVLRQKTQYENPVELYRALLGYFPWVRSVLDPFCGSGTTPLAAGQLKINYVGIEIEKEKVVCAERRLNQTMLKYNGTGE